MTTLKVPAKNPDYVSKYSTSFWFEEMVAVHEGGSHTRTLIVVDGDLMDGFFGVPFSYDIQVAYQEWLTTKLLEEALEL